MVNYYRVYPSHSRPEIVVLTVHKETPKQFVMDDFKGRIYHVNKNVIDSETGNFFSTYDLAKNQLINNIQAKLDLWRLRVQQYTSYLGNAKKLEE